MYSSGKIRGTLVLIAALGGLLLTACASTARAPRLSGQLAAGFRITRRDILSVRVDAPPSVKVLPKEKRRIAQEILRAMRDLQSAGPAGGAWRAYEVAVHITSSSAGGKFLQAAPAGRTAVLIAATVQVFSLPQRRLEETFTLSKASSRGGIFSVSASPRHTERAFAKDIARVLTGLSRGNPQQSVGLNGAGKAMIAARSAG